MDILNTELQSQLIQLIQIIIGGCLSIASIYAVILINKYTNIAKEKLNSIQDKNAKEKLNVAMDRLNSLLVTNITNTENTLKKTLIEASKDNKLTKEDFDLLKNNVAENVISQLSNDTTDIISKEVGDINDFVNIKLEEVLANLKADSNSSVEYMKNKI